MTVWERMLAAVAAVRRREQQVSAAAAAVSEARERNQGLLMWPAEGGGMRVEASPFIKPGTIVAMQPAGLQVGAPAATGWMRPRGR